VTQCKGEFGGRQMTKLRAAWTAGAKHVSSIGTWLSIPMCSNKIWKLIERILKGEVLNPSKYCPPTTHTPFNQFGKVPEDVLCTFMNLVIARKIKVSQLRGKCLVYKAIVKLKAETVVYLSNQCKINSVDPELYQFTCWEDVATHLPFLNSKGFLDMRGKLQAKMAIKAHPPSEYFAACQQEFRNKILNHDEDKVYMFNFICIVQ
jgi:hypothetical protein